MAWRRYGSCSLTRRSACDWKSATEDVGVLVLASSRTPQVNQDLIMADTLHLEPGKDGQVSIVFGAVKATTRNWPFCPARCWDPCSLSWRLASTYQPKILQGNAPCRPHGWPARKIHETGRWYKSDQPCTAGRVRRGPLSKHLVLDR